MVGLFFLEIVGSGANEFFVASVILREEGCVLATMCLFRAILAL